MKKAVCHPLRLGNRSKSPKHKASIYPVAESRSYHRNLRYLCGLFAISAICLLSGASSMTRHHKPIYTVLALVGMIEAPTACLWRREVSPSNLLRSWRNYSSIYKGSSSYKQGCVISRRRIYAFILKKRAMRLRSIYCQCHTLLRISDGKNFTCSVRNV